MEQEGYTMTNLANKEYIQTTVHAQREEHVIYGVFDDNKDFRPAKKESYLWETAFEGFFFGVKLFFFGVTGLITTAMFFWHTTIPVTIFPVFFRCLFWLSTSCAWYCFYHLCRRIFRFSVHKLISNPPDRH